MAYYRGDYYRGDYYRGGGRQRGDFLSSLRSATSGVLAKAGNLLPSKWTPAGAQTAGMGIAGGALAGAAALLAPGLLKAGSQFLGLSAPAAPAGMTWRPGGRRRLNVTNSRALRRALRRVAGFGKLARRARRDIGRAASAVGVQRRSTRARSFGRKRAA